MKGQAVGETNGALKNGWLLKNPRKFDVLCFFRPRKEIDEIGPQKEKGEGIIPTKDYEIQCL